MNEKLALALVASSKKLRPYFQCHPIVVVTTYPLRNVLHKPDLSGRLVKWAIELSEFDISYAPRTAIKSQILADFLAEFSLNLQVTANNESFSIKKHVNLSPWILHVDGSSNVKGSGLGIALETPDGEQIV